MISADKIKENVINKLTELRTEVDEIPDWYLDEIDKKEMHNHLYKIRLKINLLKEIIEDNE